MIARPGNLQGPSSMSSQVNSSRPPMTMPRPPMANPQAMPRPPISQTPPMNRPPTMPQAPMMSSPHTSQSRPPFPHTNTPTSSIRPPMPQIPSQPSEPLIRPPMSQVTSSQSVRSGNPIQSPNTVRPPIPIRPQTPQPLNRPPIPQTQQFSAAPPRPPMPQASQNQIPSGPFARPPQPAGPQHTQMNRPPIPSPQVPSIPNMRPPMPSLSGSATPLRPPVPMVPSSLAAAAPMRPPMISMAPQMPSMNGRPPMPLMPQAQQSGIASMPPGPMITSPSSKYPSGPGYIQSQNPVIQNQQPGYTQSTNMPPTQQNYPSYPQTQPAQGYTGGNMAAPHHSPAPKVNPAAIPSVVSVLDADETRFKETGQPFYTFSSVMDQPPPLPTTTSVSVIDDGNSSPQFIRSTLNHIPISEEICENSKIPLSLLIQPFAISPQTEIPLVDFGNSGPLRCNRCRAYINPHVQFIKGGRYFVCNMCDMSNEVPEEYYANLDMSGKRIDLDLRPELKFGTVDFVASKVKLGNLLCIFLFILFY